MNSDLRLACDKMYKCGALGQLEWEVLALLSAVRDKLKPAISVELGSCYGGMSYLIATVTTEKVFSVDMAHATNAEAKHERVTYVSGHTESHEVLRSVEAGAGRKIDFLFIDADHSRAAVERDYQMWSPLVRPGGWIGFHDISNPGAAGCREFWDTIQGQKIEFIQTGNHNAFGFIGWLGCGGIGVVKKP